MSKVGIVAPVRQTRQDEGRPTKHVYRQSALAALGLVLLVGVVKFVSESADYQRSALVPLGLSEDLSSSQSSLTTELVVGSPKQRFDPTEKGATEYNPEKLGDVKDFYHVARLVGADTDGSRSLCGRAEIKHNGQWGSICARGPFSATDAKVFCRTMGLAGGRARYYDGDGNPTWDSTTITHTSEKPRKPAAAGIWMDAVSCTGSEANILDCPFGGRGVGDSRGWGENVCDHDEDVGLCCDVSKFCPPKSRWRPNQHDYTYKSQMFINMMEPDQEDAEMQHNCLCDAGYYMQYDNVYSGRCLKCPPNSCSHVGSTKLDQCRCLEGFYMGPDNLCQACPAQSCSNYGSTDISECRCDAGYFLDGGAAVCQMCPENSTASQGSTEETDCTPNTCAPAVPENECQPEQKVCRQRRCRGREPSAPCQPWPACYPKPCQPWPACLQDPSYRFPTRMPSTDSEWKKYEAENGMPKACEAKDDGLGKGWVFDCSQKLSKIRYSILSEVEAAKVQKSVH